jgi:hypothetical protein
MHLKSPFDQKAFGPQQSRRIGVPLITRRMPIFGRDMERTGPTEVGVFVPPEEIFPGVESTEKALVGVLATLSRDDTLIHAARLNTLISGSGDFDPHGRQKLAVRWLCTNAQAKRLDDFAARHQGSGPLTVFFSGQIRELMRWAARHCENLPGDGTTFSERDRLDNFVKALLIAGMLWSYRTYGDKLSSGGDLSSIRQRAIGPFRKGVEESNLAPHLGIALGRGRALFVDYLPARYPEFAEAFKRATGMPLDQYRSCVAALSLYTFYNKKEGPLFLSQSVAATTTRRDVFPAYFALEGQSPEELAISLWVDFDKNGYRALREKPILITKDGRAIILDPTFFGEKISIGPLFHVLKGAGRGKVNEIFGKFGLAFEDYSTAILRRMYPSRPGLIDRVACGLRGSDGQGREFEIDASLNDVTQSVLFEMKAAWLREDSMVDDTPDRLLSDIRSKYGANLGAEGERPKGVAQLARTVGAIVRGEWLGSNKEFAQSTVIYPVLVVHDTRLDAPALGHFLEREFKVLLGAVPPGKWVAPLTIMTIQDLENLESSVANFSFIELLAAYSRECPDRLRSLHNFIAYSEFGKKILPNSYLMESSQEALQLLQRELFPGVDIPAPAQAN